MCVIIIPASMRVKLKFCIALNRSEKGDGYCCYKLCQNRIIKSLSVCAVLLPCIVYRCPVDMFDGIDPNTDIKDFFFKRLFITTQTHNLQLFGVISFIKLQNDT